jgi:hypothetical protein
MGIPGSSAWGSDFLEVWRSGDGFVGSIGLEMGFLEYHLITLFPDITEDKSFPARGFHQDVGEKFSPAFLNH